jgi:hypothetical protein
LDIKEKTIEEYAALYYRGERISNALLTILGIAGGVWTLLLYLWRQGNLSSGLFYSALPFVLFYTITGGYRFFRSINRFNNIKNLGLSYITTEEYDHLTGRVERFRRKRKIDMACVLLGFSLIVIALLFNRNHIFLATALSILGFSSTLLMFDLFGQFRTDEWYRQIQKTK